MITLGPRPAYSFLGFTFNLKSIHWLGHRFWGRIITLPWFEITVLMFYEFIKVIRFLNEVVKAA